MKKTKLLICAMAFASFAISMQAQKAYDGFETLDTLGVDEANGWADRWKLDDQGMNGIASVVSDSMFFNGFSTGNSLKLVPHGNWTRALSYNYPDEAGVSYWFSTLAQMSCDTASFTGAHNACILIANDRSLSDFLYLGTKWQDPHTTPEVWTTLTAGDGWKDITRVANEPGTPIWFVARIDMSGDDNKENVYLWANPDENLTELDTVDADVKLNVNLNAGITYVLVCTHNDPNLVMQYDEIRLGESWNDVKLNPVSVQQNTAIQLSLNASPNPFSSTTSISYNLATGQDVKVSVYDVMGKEVAILANGYQDAGMQQLSLSAEGLAAGMYVCKLQAGETVTTKSLIIQK